MVGVDVVPDKLALARTSTDRDRLSYLQGLGAFLLHYYLDLLLLWLAGVGVLLRHRKRLPALLLAAAFLALLAMANLSHRGFDHTRYQEQVYFPLVFVVSGACVMGWMSLLGATGRRRLALVLVALVFLRMGLIAQSSRVFSRRVEYMQSLVQTASAQPGSILVARVTLATPMPPD